MRIFIFFVILSINAVLSEDRCNNLRRESDCLKDPSCFWMENKTCISVVKLSQTNTGFSSRSYDPTNGQRRKELTKGIPDPRSKRKRQNPSAKDEATRRPNQ